MTLNKLKAGFYQCSFCDIKKERREDFKDCIEKGHTILPMLNENQIKENKEPEQSETHTKELYEFASKKILKIIVSKSDSKQIYAKIKSNDHVESIDLNTTKARSWLMFNHRKETNKMYSIDAYKNALEYIRADAQFDGTVKEMIYTRLAQADDAIYYDLCSPTWELLKITGSGIETIPFSEETPTFLHRQSMNEQVQPEYSDDDALEQLMQLLRISQSDRVVFKIHLISMFFERHETPIMLIHGEHGSIKTTITKTVKRIVDPSASNISSLSNRKADIPLSFHNKYLSVFDNVSELKQDVSDMFCRAITGEESSKRMLYTDADEYILQYKRKIILNGISPKIEWPDFNDRTIYYETSTISDNDKLTNEEFNHELEKLMPRILGQIFSTLSKTLTSYVTIGKPIRPFSRMGEFEKYGETIARVLGYEENEFLNRYKEKWQSSSLINIDAWPIINLIREMLKEISVFEDSVSNLHKRLKEDAKEAGIEVRGKESGFPSKPNVLSRQLKMLSPGFRKLGYELSIKPYTSNDGKYPKNNKIVYIRNNNIPDILAYQDEPN